MILKTPRRILICPLEWGLGHAGRMIPLALKLRQMDNEIFIGAGHEHLALFREELPGARLIEFKGFKPAYSGILPQYLILLFKLPVLIWNIISEHNRLGKIVREHSIDIVISDNRFGLWHRGIKTVYISHMHRIPFPGRLKMLEPAGIHLHRFIIKKFSLCFIPDVRGELNLSGRLSHGLKLPSNTRYTGILSRFSGQADSGRNEFLQGNRAVLILSGPEPQRRILKQKITDIFRNGNMHLTILEGRPGASRDAAVSGNIRSFSHLPSMEYRRLLLESDYIIARSGYSTIMELVSLNRSALLIPTPGQTEQEYLARYLSERGWFATADQKHLGTGLTMPPCRDLPAEAITAESMKLLDEALKELLDQQQDNDAQPGKSGKKP